MASSMSRSFRGRARFRDHVSPTRPSSKTSAMRWCCMCSRCNRVGRCISIVCPAKEDVNNAYDEKTREEAMKSARMLMLGAGTALASWPVIAADVTPERLLNADKEPQNWLMNHRTYDGQRYSPLDRINRGNVKLLNDAYAVPLGREPGNE